MGELEERFTSAKANYQVMIEEDFPDFNLEDYAAKKQMEISQPKRPARAVSQKKSNLKKKLFSKFDVSGDGRFDFGDLAKMSETVTKNVSTAAQDIGESVSRAASSFDAGEVTANAKDAIGELGKSIAETNVAEVAGTAVKIGKTAVGIQGVQNRKEIKEIREVCEEYYNAAEAVTEQKRQELNFSITGFGEYRLSALHLTVGRFLQCLKDLRQNNAVKEYEILFGAAIDTKTLEKMESMDMAASEALRSTAITGAFGVAAALGTPAIVAGTVGAFATASTGTAISSLSGVAASNAVLAWLGGGSLAAGGGGMAAGAVALTAIAASATAVVSILAAGSIVSMHYGKKLTEAKEYEQDVGVAVAGLEKAWIVMDGVSERTAELREVTEELKWRTSGMLDDLEQAVPEFDFADKECLTIFNKSAHLVKTMVELAQTPLLDDEGNLSTENISISSKVRKVLNTEV